ncbi:MAG: 1-deoxy-D-xylulose 5-phosphate reductoisomerase [Bacteriovoracaceae bacterium]|nr:1-deoxy-D-xylulose 5-phosphate reductoisomerase [Bacteriovoracaceae bacterium]
MAVMQTSSPKRVAILGSTGSVGVNTLNVIRQHPEKFKVVSLSCGSSLALFKKQIEEFSPLFVSVATAELAFNLKSSLSRDQNVRIYFGVDGHQKCIEESTPDILMSSMTGTFGLKASLQGVVQGVSILGIANKEILVMAGSFIIEALEKSPTELIPVDSEHSAIFQALMGNKKSAVKSIILTGSGGPFRLRDAKTFDSIKKEEALKHPNWSMGAKITIDSSTMMNKGLEFIEAVRLFGLPAEKIKIVIHPESLVHSLVEYCDGSIMAQLGLSDMRIPIALALSYPDRISLDLGKSLNLVEAGALHFEEPDFEKFPCLGLALKAEAMGRQGSIILNSANEVAVERFLKDEITYLEIPSLVEDALVSYKSARVNSLDEVIDLDIEVKSWSKNWSFVRPRYRREGSFHERVSV